MKRVLVFCGSSPGLRPEYATSAANLGRELASRDLEVVYGGASVGLMGALADATLAAGGTVIGVIPSRLVQHEIAHAGLSKLHVTETMHERKALMAELSDGVIALPGGSGTLDELFELFTWKQLGLHRKPIGLLNVSGYWRPLLDFLEHAVNERFLRAEYLEDLQVEESAAALVDRLATHEHRSYDKWMDRPAADQAVPNTRSPASPNPGRM
ncbi:MAG TPA: TIGR00730 family Rossman fold protein [Solirubrobacteraceae bacterium]|nr:TIGR00730 family Rossman fold protein [Solirubrobacteraceae bacterium]